MNAWDGPPVPERWLLLLVLQPAQ